MIPDPSRGRAHQALRAALCLGWALLPLLGVAPPFRDLPGRMYWPSFNDRNGLPENSIYALAPDLSGRLWAGTQAGIARYDGYRWTIQEPPPSNNAYYVNSNAICPRSDGSVWFGMRFQGILAYDQGRWSVHDKSLGLTAKNINEILESSDRDSKGQPVVYAASHGQGVFRFAEGRWKPFGLDHHRVFCLHYVRDAKGHPQLWAGTGEGLWFLEKDRWSPFSKNDQLPDLKVRDLATTEDGQGVQSIWIGLEDGGLFRYRAGKLESMKLQEQFGTGRIRCLLPDQNRLWVATVGAGVLGWKDGEWIRLDRERGLPIPYARTLAITPGGRSQKVLWIGLDGAGITRMGGSNWISLAPPWNHEDPRVQCLWETKDSGRSQILMGSYSKGLARLDRQGLTWLPPGKGQPLDNIRFIFQFPGDGTLYLAGDKSFCTLGAHPRLFKAQDGLPPGQIRSMAGTQTGAKRILWLGTSRGLIAWDGQAFKTHALPNGEISIRCLFSVGSDLWVGSDRGLFFLKNGQWASFGALKALEESSIQALLQEPSGRLWVGTYGSGLAMIPKLQDSSTLRWLSPQSTPALPHKVVNGLALDSRHRIWVSTIRGVARLEAHIENLKIETFTHEDGLPSMECLQGTLMRDHAGRIWVGTMQGLTYLEKEGPESESQVQSLTWDKVAAASQSLSPGSHLPHSVRDLIFGFRLLSYHREEEIRYQTQLVGLHDHPSEWSSDPWVRFPSLPAGSYRLKVWGRDWAGLVSAPLEFPFTIRTAPWFHPLAIAAYGLSFLGLITLLFQLRTRLLKRRNAELARKVQEATEELVQREMLLAHQAMELVTTNEELRLLNSQKNHFFGIVAHDLRNPLSGITLSAELLLDEEDPEQRRKDLERIMNTCRSMTGLLTRFLDIDKIESGQVKPSMMAMDLVSFLLERIERFQPQTQVKEQTLEFSPPSNPIWGLADPQFLKEIVDNLLSNAVKYSPKGGWIRLDLENHPPTVSLRISDSGPGFTEEDKERLWGRFVKLSAKPTGGEDSVGLGLSITRQMVLAMGGSVRLESETGQGACFIVELPMADRAQ